MQARPAPTVPTPPPAAQGPARPAPPPAAQAPTLPPAFAAPQVIPPNEPAAVTRLRALFGDDTRLSYASAQVLDGAGEQVRLTGVVLEKPGKRATMDEVTLNGLRADGVTEAVLRGFTTTEAGTTVRIAMLRLAGLTVQRDAPGTSPQPEQVTLASLRMENLQASGATTLRVGLVELEGWAAGKPARLAIEGLESSDFGGGAVDAVRIARFAMSGLDAARMMGALIRGEAVPSLVGRSSLEMLRMELLAGGRPVGGIAETRIEADITAANGSGSGTIAIRGIRVEPLPMIAEWLTRFGYQAIEGEITAATAHDATAGRVEIRDLTIAAREAGTLTFSMNLDGLTPDRVQTMDYSQARLISAALGYADASLFRRFIAMQAAQTRTPEAQLREQFAAMAGGALSQPGAVALDPIRDAVLSFIRGQAQSVQIRMNPPQPIGMAEMQQVPPSPAEMQRVLGISATAR
ncbi:hypothetical protein AAFN86_10400 [Roseomonas sp. CAU 1739]